MKNQNHLKRNEHIIEKKLKTKIGNYYMMLKIFLRPNLIRRFTHTHSKTIFLENNSKVIEDLIRQQNERLKEIKNEISDVCICLSCLIITIAFKLIK